MNDLEETVRGKNIFSYISKPELNLELSLSTTTYAEAETSLLSQELSSFQKSVCSPSVVGKKQLIYEGCSSSKWNIGPLVPPDHAYTDIDTIHTDKNSINQELSISRLFDTHGVTREKARKKAAVKSCQFKGCKTRARDATGLCIRHGGGKRCGVQGCKKSAEGKIVFCIAHGGGPRCQSPGCNKGAQGRTMLCKGHGGGKRCTFLGCERSAAEGRTQLCKGHGGGKRCTHEDGCSKSAHGRTLFCVRHGGGKRCGTTDCKKSARGSTSHCVRHGGGKRCTHVECDKSVQGGTDFCKSHGGGKRCSWGDEPCEKFARGRSGLCFAHNAQVGSASSLQHLLQASQSQHTELEGRVHGGNYFQNTIFGSNCDLP